MIRTWSWCTIGLSLVTPTDKYKLSTGSDRMTSDPLNNNKLLWVKTGK